MKLERERNKGKQVTASLTNTVLQLMFILLWLNLASLVSFSVNKKNSCKPSKLNMLFNWVLKTIRVLPFFKKFFFQVKFHSKLKFKYLNYFSTEYRSTSTQASTPEEHKVDKGMQLASLIIQ